MNVCEQVRYFRKAQGLTATELAGRSGVNQTTISFIENEKVNPTLDTIEKLVEAMGCEIRIMPKIWP